MTDIELELDEEYLNDGPAACDDCGETYPASSFGMACAPTAPTAPLSGAMQSPC